MHAAIEDDRGVFLVGHPKFLGALEAAQRDLRGSVFQATLCARRQQ